MELDRAIELMQKKIKCLYDFDLNDLNRCSHACKECEFYMTTEEEEAMSRKALEVMEEYRSKEKKVRCIDCKHLRVELIKQRNLPDSICVNPLWKELGRAPHVIGHDEHEPIRCDYFEKKEGIG